MERERVGEVEEKVRAWAIFPESNGKYDQK